jgi:hypothetical protein
MFGISPCCFRELAENNGLALSNFREDLKSLLNEYSRLRKHQCSNRFEVSQGCHSFVVIIVQLESFFSITHLLTPILSALQLQQ